MPDDDEVDVLEPPLSEAAAGLTVVLRGRRKAAGSAAESLSPSQRLALNTWVDLIVELELTVVIPREASALIFGTGKTSALTDAARVMDDTWELLQPLGPSAKSETASTVAFLFDADAGRDGAWPVVMEALAKRRLITRGEAEILGRSPGGVTVHAAPIFVQPLWDVVADDEFQLDNELAHKLTDCIVRERFGSLPENLRQGLGYVVEQRLYASIYQFNTTGFVRTADHFDWPRKTQEFLEKVGRRKDFRLGRFLEDAEAGGTPGKPQLVTWGVLDYLLFKDVERLSDLLTDLSELHAVAARGQHGKTFLGDPEAVREILEVRLAGLEAGALARHVKRIK